eukprot:SAG31_NODE_452_length_15484_cov_20.883198_6_plen_235_part_00
MAPAPVHHSAVSIANFPGLRSKLPVTSPHARRHRPIQLQMRNRLEDAARMPARPRSSAEIILNIAAGWESTHSGAGTTTGDDSWKPIGSDASTRHSLQSVTSDPALPIAGCTSLNLPTMAGFHLSGPKPRLAKAVQTVQLHRELTAAADRRSSSSTDRGTKVPGCIAAADRSRRRLKTPELLQGPGSRYHTAVAAARQTRLSNGEHRRVRWTSPFRERQTQQQAQLDTHKQRSR